MTTESLALPPGPEQIKVYVYVGFVRLPVSWPEDDVPVYPPGLTEQVVVFVDDQVKVAFVL